MITKLREAGLEAESPTEIDRNKMGIAPAKFEEAKNFKVPSVGSALGGRIFVYEKKSEAEELKNYFDMLGETAGNVFFTYIH